MEGELVSGSGWEACYQFEVPSSGALSHVAQRLQSLNLKIRIPKIVLRNRTPRLSPLPKVGQIFLLHAPDHGAAALAGQALGDSSKSSERAVIRSTKHLCMRFP